MPKLSFLKRTNTSASVAEDTNTIGGEQLSPSYDPGFPGQLDEQPLPAKRCIHSPPWKGKYKLFCCRGKLINAKVFLLLWFVVVACILGGIIGGILVSKSKRRAATVPKDDMATSPPSNVTDRTTAPFSPTISPSLSLSSAVTPPPTLTAARMADATSDPLSLPTAMPGPLSPVSEDIDGSKSPTITSVLSDAGDGVLYTLPPKVVTQTAPPTQALVPPTPPEVFKNRNDIEIALASVSGTDALLDPASPQSAGLRWIIEDQRLRANSDGLEEIVEDGDVEMVVQRYVLATFFFATTAESDAQEDVGEVWTRKRNLRSVALSSPLVTEEEWGQIDEGGARTTTGRKLKSTLIAEEERGWLSGIAECEWHGVECDLAGLVDSIVLDDAGLSGALIPELSELPSLRVLSLRDNYLTGTIPPHIGNAYSLVSLALGNNELTGTIPSELGAAPRLESLNAENNALSGTLPREFGPALRILDLQRNELEGTLPEYAQSPNLKLVDLSSNSLSGQIPVTIGSLRYLETIRLSNNRLTGRLSPGIFGPALRTFDVEMNGISGLLPEGIFNGSPELVNLSLGGNGFIGTLPESFGELVNLETLVLYMNHFTGGLPSTIAKLRKLSKIVGEYYGIRTFHAH